MQFPHGSGVHDRIAADAQEARSELAVEAIERLAHDELPAAAVDDEIVASGFGPIHGIALDEYDALASFHGDAMRAERFHEDFQRGKTILEAGTYLFELSADGDDHAHGYDAEDVKRP
jgi:hypothetical protein